MVKIRLSRVGRHKRPFYRIVVATSTAPRNGEQIEILGTYDPLNKQTCLKEDRASYWVGQGAIPTETVKTLLKKVSIKEGEDKIG